VRAWTAFLCVEGRVWGSGALKRSNEFLLAELAHRCSLTYLSPSGVNICHL
jgi:hypothetical protein